MATIGLRKPYFAKYVNTAGVITYTGGGLMGKAVEVSASIESGDDNNLYADDGIAEADRSFNGGTLTLGTDDLTQEVAAVILGITPSSIEIGEEEYTELIYNDDMSIPDLGVGFVISKIKNGARLYRAIVFNRIKFSIPEDAATTQGETIEWQTPSIEGAIMRDDSAKRAWKHEATFEDAAVAEAYVKKLLNIV